MADNEPDFFWQWSCDYGGYVRLHVPRAISPRDMEDIEELMGIAIRTLSRHAARHAEAGYCI